MITTSIGLFDSFPQAVRAVTVLLGCGLRREEISIVVQTNEPYELSSDTRARAHPTIDKSKLVLPVELDTFGHDAQSLVVGGIGCVAMAGPLAFVLARAADKTQSGDLIGALAVFDVFGEEANSYAEGVRRGGTFVAVTAAEHLSERAEDVLLLHGAVDIRQRARRWQREGWRTFHETARPYRATDHEQERRRQAEERTPGRDWNPYERDFRSHYYLTYSDDNLPYENYAPAYRYGYQLASDTRYHEQDWDDIEPQIQRTWGRQQDTDWSTVADAVRYGFLKGRENDWCRERVLTD
jgi:hypothetical protein